jgi:hypothetical protein
MHDMPFPADPSGFFVEWQLADDADNGTADRVIDLSGRPDVEVVMPDDTTVTTRSGS